MIVSKLLNDSVHNFQSQANIMHDEYIALIYGSATRTN